MTTKDVISLSFDGGTTEYLIKDSTARTNIGDLSNLTTTAKDNLVAAINEAATTGGGGGSVTVDSELSTTSVNPVQNKVITNTINAKEQALYGRIWSNVANPSAGYFETKYEYNNGSFAQLWNENDGGGSLVFDKTANVKSYVGTNLEEGNGANASAVNVQIYSLDDTTKEGTRINANQTGAFYVKGAKGQGNPAGREIAVKDDIAGLDTVVDRQAADTAIISKIWSNSTMSGGYFKTKYDHNNGSFAQIWNESDGGGSLVFDKTDNVKSYVGTNLVEGEGADAGAVNVQIYSFDDTTKNGVRINVNANKAFYVKGAKGQGNPVGREIATIEDLPVDVSEEVTALTETVEGLSETVTGYDESISTLTDSVATQGGNITAVLSRLELVEDKLAAQAKTNIDTEVVEDTITLNDDTIDYIVRGSFTERSVITGKSVTVKDSTVEAAVLNLTATDDLDLKGTDISGTYDRSTQGNSMVNIHSDGYVTIKNCTISADGYNAIEIGLTKGEAKNVLIDNVRFEGTFSNNAISIFGTEDDAVITISNCTFENVSNVFRISNRTNVGCTINIINCTCNSWNPEGDYAGMILCQDYTSATAEDAEANNLFSPAKIKINIQNFIKPDGTRLATPEDYSEVCGSGDENQIVYVYYDKGGLVAYDETKYPALTIS